MNTINFNTIISLENLLTAWREFVAGKSGKSDVQLFERNLMDNLMTLHTELQTGIYRHGFYDEFRINDPKPRKISKASVRDRLIHHAIHRVLYPHFDRRFIADSFSCRNDKGSHAAGLRFQKFAAQASHNHTCACWVLKCDVRKFFASIDHQNLLEILGRSISDKQILSVIDNIVCSFSDSPGRGLPLGNLTSQLFANIYMNEFDQFVKQELREPYYIRYADDFAFMSHSKEHLEEILTKIKDFLEQRLKLTLHPDKVFIETISSGVDFLGWVYFPTHQVLRTVTRKRMERRLKISPTRETIQSYLGLLKHGNTFKLSRYCQSIGELYRA